jgi:hypothetical protein
MVALAGVWLLAATVGIPIYAAPASDVARARQALDDLTDGGARQAPSALERAEDGPEMQSVHSGRAETGEAAAPEKASTHGDSVADDGSTGGHGDAVDDGHGDHGQQHADAHGRADAHDHASDEHGDCHHHNEHAHHIHGAHSFDDEMAVSMILFLILLTIGFEKIKHELVSDRLWCVRAARGALC